MEGEKGLDKLFFVIISKGGEGGEENLPLLPIWDEDSVGNKRVWYMEFLARSPHHYKTANAEIPHCLT